MHWAADQLYQSQSDAGGPGIEAARKMAWGGWAYQLAVNAALLERRITFPRSVEEAYEIVESLPSPYSEEIQPKADSDEAILSAYQALVARRFGLLPSVR